jgi:hypothetical protein
MRCSFKPKFCVIATLGVKHKGNQRNFKHQTYCVNSEYACMERQPQYEWRKCGCNGQRVTPLLLVGDAETGRNGQWNRHEKQQNVLAAIKRSAQRIQKCEYCIDIQKNDRNLQSLRLVRICPAVVARIHRVSLPHTDRGWLAYIHGYISRIG